MKLSRHQFYVLAAMATFAHGTFIHIDTKKGQAENGDITIAWKPKKDSTGWKERGKKGFAVAKMNKDGNTTFLKGK